VTGALTAGLDEQEKKVSIFDAAARLFAAKGYTGTSVREIVEAAGVTKPTLYYYFKNKEDLYLQLIDMTMGIFSGVLDSSLSVPGTMRERLFRLFTNINSLFKSNVDLLRLVNLIIYGPRESTPVYDLSSIHVKLEGSFHALLDEGIAEGELAEERRGEVMLLLMGLLRSMQVLIVLSQLHSPLSPTDIRRVVNAVFDGVRPEKLSEK
jgi:AcrR family transcriptional regulator